MQEDVVSKEFSQNFKLTKKIGNAFDDSQRRKSLHMYNELLNLYYLELVDLETLNHRVQICHYELDLFLEVCHTNGTPEVTIEVNLDEDNDLTFCLLGPAKMLTREQLVDHITQHMDQ